MRRFWLRARMPAICLVPFSVCCITVLIVLGTYTHLALSHTAPEFSPYGGSSRISTTNSYQEFWFNTAAIDAWNGWSGGVNPPHPHRAYEHNTQIPINIVEYDGAWRSNQPGAYLDNWYGDDDAGVTDLTIGADQASQFHPSTYYYHQVNIQLTGQGSPTNVEVNIDAQLLYRTYAGDPGSPYVRMGRWVFCTGCQWGLWGPGGHSAAACCNFIHDHPAGTDSNEDLHTYMADLTNPVAEYWTHP